MRHICRHFYPLIFFLLFCSFLSILQRFSPSSILPRILKGKTIKRIHNVISGWIDEPKISYTIFFFHFKQWLCTEIFTTKRNICMPLMWMKQKKSAHEWMEGKRSEEEKIGSNFEEKRNVDPLQRDNALYSTCSFRFRPFVSVPRRINSCVWEFGFHVFFSADDGVNFFCTFLPLSHQLNQLSHRLTANRIVNSGKT